ncbi:MAG TPA: hypothetical protein VFI32_07000 [Rhodanobacteraceae bacterium]|nr:hypothetical protein [Rhodanobacteraceae bacterium]
MNDRQLARIGILLLTAFNLPIAAQTATDWQQRQLQAMSKADAIMQRAQAYQGLLTQYRIMRRAYAADRDPAFRSIFGQYLSWQLSFLGDYAAAEKAFSVPRPAQADDAPSPLEMTGYRPVPAIDYLPRLAAKHRVLFFNEAHNIALTRTLTTRLLRALRAEGFNTFAVETLRRSDIDGLRKRGYPIETSGFYTREPIYAEMVRTALKLGYRVVAYEADESLNGDAREAQQAQHLWNILRHDPHARLVVNAGYEHIVESGPFLGTMSMAEHFRQDSGIVPLTVEQTWLIPHPEASQDHPVYRQIIAALHPRQPLIFIGPGGKPWSLRPGYDVSVIFPAEHLQRGRPTWLGLWGLRVPFAVKDSICRERFPCVVQARYADEGDDAVPADRVVLDPAPLMTIGDTDVFRDNSNFPAGELYLRPGDYVLTAIDENGHTVGRRTIQVITDEAPKP